MLDHRLRRSVCEASSSLELLTSLQFLPSVLGEKRHCRGRDALLSLWNGPGLDLCGNPEVRLDGVVESVALQ